MKPPGKMTTHKTGAKREDKTGKGRFDLLSPIMLKRLAILSEEGGVAHGDRNWEKGMKLSTFLDSAFRHLVQTIDGCEDKDHPIQAIWNLQGYIHTLHLIRTGDLPPELDDLPREKNLQKIERSWKVKVPFTVQLSEPSMCPPVRKEWCYFCGQDKEFIKTLDKPVWGVRRICNGCYWREAYKPENLLGKNLTPPDEPTIKQHERSRNGHWCVDCGKKLAEVLWMRCSDCLEKFDARR